jgi:hypothetical protein
MDDVGKCGFHKTAKLFYDKIKTGTDGQTNAPTVGYAKG